MTLASRSLSGSLSTRSRRSPKGSAPSPSDAEYADLCRRLIGKLARKRPTPLVRGAPRIWAAGVLYAVGRANFLFDRSQPIHLTGDELATLTGVPKTTMANKARRICDLVGLGPLDFEFSRRDLLRRNPPFDRA